MAYIIFRGFLLASICFFMPICGYGASKDKQLETNQAFVLVRSHKSLTNGKSMGFEDAKALLRANQGDLKKALDALQATLSAAGTSPQDTAQISQQPVTPVTTSRTASSKQPVTPVTTSTLPTPPQSLATTSQLDAQNALLEKEKACRQALKPFLQDMNINEKAITKEMLVKCNYDDQKVRNLIELLKYSDHYPDLKLTDAAALALLEAVNWHLEPAQLSLWRADRYKFAGDNIAEVNSYVETLATNCNASDGKWIGNLPLKTHFIAELVLRFHLSKKDALEALQNKNWNLIAVSRELVEQKMSCSDALPTLSLSHRFGDDEETVQARKATVSAFAAHYSLPEVQVELLLEMCHYHCDHARIFIDFWRSFPDLACDEAFAHLTETEWDLERAIGIVAPRGRGCYPGQETQVVPPLATTSTASMSNTIAATWEVYIAERRVWEPFSTADSKALEAAFQGAAKVIFTTNQLFISKLSKTTYSFNFQTMQQFNTSSKTTRPIRRV